MALTRREFLNRTAAAAAAASLTNVTGSFGEDKKKVRFAQIGCGGRGKAHHGMWRSNTFVAAVDANRRATKMFSEKQYPNLKRYSDYREMFENEADNIDAVIVATPDHNHYPAAMLALQHGKAVFCEKPVAWSVQECLDLAKVVAAKKLPSQMGNQGNAGQGWRDIYSIVHSDVLGEIESCHTWTNRPIWPQGNPRAKGEDPIPADMDWNAWIGPAAMRPYKNGIYHPFKWRGFYDFGCGALGDMACHTMNSIFQVMKPDYNLTVEPVLVEGRSPDGDQYPKAQIIKWIFAKSGKCPGFECFWYDGNKKPEKPKALGQNNLPRTGSMYVGTKGVLISASDYNDRPTIYIDGKIIKPKVESMVEGSPGMHAEFLAAVKGEKPWDYPKSNFTYAGKITAIINMGTVAERVGKKLTFSTENMKFDDSKANEMMGRTPRKGWEKPYRV